MKKDIVAALVGNPNVGKTAIMNALCGTKAKIGNWPGVTVEKKEGNFTFRGFSVKLIDLPGIYSLSSYTIEERVTRNFLLKEKLDVVLDIVDVTLLGRNLYLTLELLEMGMKPIIVLNKMDDVKGYNVNFKKLSTLLGLSVIPVSAYGGLGLSDLSEKIVEVALGGMKGNVFQPVYSETIEAAIDELSVLLKEVFPEKSRWYAIKIFEGDAEILDEVLGSSIGERFGKILERVKREFFERKGEDIGAFIARERFVIASDIAKEVIEAKKECENECLEDKIDRFVTTPLTGIPIFFFIMGMVFKITFTLSSPFIKVIETVFRDYLPSLLYSFEIPGILKSIIDKGVFAGVGSVLSFLPILFILYIILSILEDSGYMARAAALWDNFMRLFGLSGASVIPLILGFGCNVPAVYSTRAMRSPAQKLITMLAIPWISCSARLAVYTVFIAAFFENYRTVIVLILYMTGIFIALLFSKILSSFFVKDDDEFFIELPAYKIPSLKVVVNQTVIEVRDFIEKAGTIIFFASVLIWVLASFPFGVAYAGEHSVAGMIGNFLLPVFKPLGITDWKPVVALIFGGVAKEVVVGTMGTLYGDAESLTVALRGAFSPASAIAYLFFVLLYVPCVATVSAIYQESGSKLWVILIVVVELVIAWMVSFFVYHFATFIF